MSFIDWVRKGIVTFGFTGCIPGAPGTWGTLAAAAMYVIVLTLGWTGPALEGGVVLAAFGGCLLLGDWAVEHFGRHDPGAFVLDEVAGFWVAIFWLPASSWPISVPAAVILFRIFDVWKPYPLSKLETLPGGLGIAADDIAAGVLANLCVRLILTYGT